MGATETLWCNLKKNNLEWSGREKVDFLPQVLQALKKPS